MFSRSQRFQPVVKSKSAGKKDEAESVKVIKPNLPPPPPLVTPISKELNKASSKEAIKGDSLIKKTKQASSVKFKNSATVLGGNKSDVHSQCGSSASTKSYVSASSNKNTTKGPNSVKKPKPCAENKTKSQVTSSAVSDDIIKSQEVEIKNKDYTISEYKKQIEELKNEIVTIKKQLPKVTILDQKKNSSDKCNKWQAIETNYERIINTMNIKISELENQCKKLEHEVGKKQVELTSMEELIAIRDCLCRDLQDKLNDVESCLDETKQRLDMVKGHHVLALEANESIRKEYKAELETLKSKFEEEKQNIITKFKIEQDNIMSKYTTILDSLKKETAKEKDYIGELQQQLIAKEYEMTAKIEQIEEAAREKIRICEIQFEERSRAMDEHWSQRQQQLQYLEKEKKDLQYSLQVTQDQNSQLQNEIKNLKCEIAILKSEKSNNDKVETKKVNELENEISKLTEEVQHALKDKDRFQMSLTVTRDIVNVLSLRLRESDEELEHLENKVKTLSTAKQALEEELSKYKNTLNDTILECSEYKEALVNILKSKAELAKEHTRIMEHNVTLIESLQNVEKEAFRELGSIKNELIEDVELLKKESDTQIMMLREEVEKKRVLCELAKEHAGQATAAAEQSRELLVEAASEISRLETENQRLKLQIQDQQSLVVELSLLRQENEELTVTVAKQSSMLEKIIKDAEGVKPKSPSFMNKVHSKPGKENVPVAVSPLRERNN